MRYADHKKTLDKYGGTKETISIWAPSYTPHIPKIARNSNSLLPETTLSKILGQPQILKFKISVVFIPIVTNDKSPQDELVTKR